MLKLGNPIIKAHLRTWRQTTAVLCGAMILTASTNADVVTMLDGRRFEGDVLTQDKQTVKIDTVVAGIRTTLTLKHPEIASVTQSPVPDGFFDPPAVADRVSDAHSFTAKDNLYLNVPIIGTFGQTVLAKGLSNTLAYAARHGIPHIVFLVDSDGGDLDEAQAAYELLGRYDQKLTYHAVLRHCVGDALAIPLWCSTLHVLPGATIGGSNRKWSELSDKIEPQEEAIIRAQVAFEVAAETQKHRRHVRGSQLVRAMIDPAATVAVWRNDQGELVTGAKAPPDLPTGKLVFEDGPHSVLALSYDQVVELGAQPFDGDMDQLGDRLGLTNWKQESDFGQDAMKKAVAARRTQIQETSARYESSVRQNIQRRKTTERYISHNLKEAAAWDPSKSSYATYAGRWRWGHHPTNRLTRESRTKWRDRSDASIAYLRRAAKGISSMKKLDAEAVQLGLAPTYDPEQLNGIIDDIETKYSYLQKNRDKKSN